MKVYLAARFSRKPELLEYRKQLMDHGIEVTSRWLIGNHEWVGTNDEELPVHVGKHFADEDLEDIQAADVMVCFTEPPREVNNSRGGRHVEFGYALALEKEVLVVGHRENVFHCVQPVKFHEAWESAITQLVMWNGLHLIDDPSVYDAGIDA